MNVRLTPTDARNLLEANVDEFRASRASKARERSAERRRKAKEEREWKKQSTELFRAALEGNNEFIFDCCLTRPENLIALGFRIFAIKDIYPWLDTVNELTEMEETEAKKLRMLTGAWIHEIRRTERSITSHEEEMLRRLLQNIIRRLEDIEEGDLIRCKYISLVRIIRYAIDQFECDDQIDSETEEWLSRNAPILFDNDSFWEEIEWLTGSEFGPEIDDIEAQFKVYLSARATLNRAEEDMPCDVLLDDSNFHENEPPYRVSWSTQDCQEYWSDQELISLAGLGWLSGKIGQSFLGYVENKIVDACSRLNKTIELKVLYSSEDGFFIETDNLEILSCPSPARIVELSQLQGWTIKNSPLPGNSCLLEISW